MASSQFVDGWDIVRTLGEGSYGEVKLLINPRSQQALALKIIDLGDNPDPDSQKNVQKETMIMRLLTHENIIRLYGHRVEPPIHFLFLEYAEGGELFDRIEPDVGMNTECAQFYFRQLIAGVEYLHSRGVAHRDLKPENLLITKDDILKISDFGMATIFRHKGRERKCKSRCGTLPYVAPEVLYKEYSAEPADIWSCGIILVALLSGELPWDSPNTECKQFADWKEKRNLDQSPWCKIEIVALSLLKAILQCNVDTRACIAKIKGTRWFTKDYSKHNVKLHRLNSGDAFQHKSKRLKFAHDEIIRDRFDGSLTQPEVTGIRLDDEDCDSNEGEFPFSLVNPSFTQPANIESLLTGTQTQSQATQSQGVDPIRRLVRRMTRFCVELSLEKSLKCVVSACRRCGFTTKTVPPSQITILTVDKRRNKLCFKASMYEMGEKVLLVDFRLSQGDGIEFKKKFLQLKKKLTDIISHDSHHWLQMRGLVNPVPIDKLSLQ